MTASRPIKRALVSVFHKEGIETLAKAFVEAGTEVVSTGSTAKRLAELGVTVTEVSEVTGFPECLDGRVKTLDPHIHAGILADMTNPDHAAQLEQFGIKPFDLVVVNLYPFADTVRSGANEADTIEKIDIGGPTMVRAAAKNSAHRRFQFFISSFLPLWSLKLAPLPGTPAYQRTWSIIKIIRQLVKLRALKK